MPIAQLVVTVSRYDPSRIVIWSSNVKKFRVVSLREDKVMRSFDIHGVVLNEAIGVVWSRIGDGFNLKIRGQRKKRLCGESHVVVDNS